MFHWRLQQQQMSLFGQCRAIVICRLFIVYYRVSQSLINFFPFVCSSLPVNVSHRDMLHIKQYVHFLEFKGVFNYLNPVISHFLLH